MADYPQSAAIGERGREPLASYVRLDAVPGAEYDYYLGTPDADGDAILGGGTEESVRFNSGVCVLVAEGVTTEDAARALRKMANWVEDGALDLFRED